MRACGEFCVYKVPCIFVYKDGKLVERFTTTMSKQELTNFVEKYMDDSIAAAAA